MLFFKTVRMLLNVTKNKLRKLVSHYKDKPVPDFIGERYSCLVPPLPPLPLTHTGQEKNQVLFPEKRHIYSFSPRFRLYSQQ